MHSNKEQEMIIRSYYTYWLMIEEKGFKVEDTFRYLIKNVVTDEEQVGYIIKKLES